MKNALAHKTFQHPYDLKTARWIREKFILEHDDKKRSEFLEGLAEMFGHRAAEVLAYVGNDYRVMIRDDQMHPEYDDKSWNGLVFCCGRAYGKALKNNQLVKTPVGWKEIGDMVVGDEISTISGGVQEVTAVYPQGVVNLFKLTTLDGRESEACKDHLWTGRFGGKQHPTGDVVTVKTSEIYQRHLNGERFFLPRVSGEDDIQVPSDLPIAPYLLGLLIGDGNMTHTRVSISTSDPQIVSAFSDAGYEINKYVYKYDWGIPKLVPTMRSLGLMGTGSHTKFIPDIYKESNYHQREELLKGLLDTDGSITKAGCVDYTSVSLQLIKDVQWLCWSLGHTATLNERYTKCNGKSFKSYRLYIRASKTSSLFKLPRHLERANDIGSRDWILVKDIIPTTPAEATCISVSDPRQLFITNNYLVTHNTYCGAPAVIDYAIEHPNARIGLIAPTFGMGRTNMIEGSSGILQISPKGFKPTYNKSDGSLTWPNGATAKLFSAENGDRVRGENLHFLWADEFCFFKFTNGDDDVWKMAKMALRAGRDPKYIITTSPRPIKQIKELNELSKKPKSKVVFRTGTTFDNYALPQSYIDEVKLGEGTSLYNQEILGMILEENTNAIFVNENILRIELDVSGEDYEEYDKRLQKLIEGMDSIVVGVDPNVVEDIESDETGIVVCGRKGDKGYVFKDASRRGKISDIYKTVIDLYYEYRADCIVVETNNGGDFIPNAIFNIDPHVVVEKVFASRGKRARAEPIGLLYERKKIYHVGIHRELEAQMTEYNPQVHSKSPDYLKSVWSS